jgi:hypothetical protein
MSIFSLACPTVGCYQNFVCDPEFQNKVVAVAYIEKGTTINKSTADAWRISLLQAVLDGNGFIVFNVSGEKPKPETATTSGRGMQNTKALAKTHTLSYQDMQGVVAGNVEWYNQMLAASQNYDLYYFTPNQIWDASGAYVTVIGDPVVTAELNTYMMSDVQVTWVSKVNPLPYKFDTDYFLQGLYFNIQIAPPASGPPISTFTASQGGIIQNPNQAFLNSVGITTPTGLKWSIQDGADEVPAGLEVVPNSGVILIDAATPVGVYELTTVVTNAFGCVFGTLDVTITVTV